MEEFIKDKLKIEKEALNYIHTNDLITLMAKCDCAPTFANYLASKFLTNAERLGALFIVKGDDKIQLDKKRLQMIKTTALQLWPCKSVLVQSSCIVEPIFLQI